MKTRRLLYILPTVLISAIVLIVLYKKQQPDLKKTITPAVTVETARVQEISVAEQTETIGNLKSINQVNITSELPGQIKAIHFNSGDTVKKGALLVELDDSILKSEWSAAKASLALSESNYKRFSELAKKRMVSAQALDEALADYKDKKNQVTIKQAQLKKMSLRAPFSGKLSSRQISVGQYVTVGEPIVRLVATRKLRIEYHLPERYLPLLATGQQVSILSDAYPERVFKATVNYIDPVVDEETRSIAIEALLDNSNSKLSPGLFVKVNHQFNTEKKRLLVPEESLIPTISGQKIFILRDNKAVAINVETGAHHAEMTEILKGLSLSDIIIVRGQHKLKDGTEVIDVQKG